MTDSATDRQVGVDRRSALLAAAATGAGAFAVGALSPKPAAAHTTSVPAINVKDHGAVGDGSTDDRAAIQSALDEVPASGAWVFFPSGDYAVSGPLLPKSRTLITGTHSPRYDSDVNLDSLCKVRCRSNFSGAGLIAPAAGISGVTIRNLALIGNGVGTDVCGIRFPDAAETTGEMGWMLEDVNVAGFSGDGIRGNIWVATLLNCHIACNLGWGINCSGGNAWTDGWVANTQIYFNNLGGIQFTGSKQSGFVEFVNCRIELSGRNFDSVPANVGSPGISVTNAAFLQFTNCITDRNNGHGAVFATESSGDIRPANIFFANCLFNGDGVSSTGGPYAGLKVLGVSAQKAIEGVRCANCAVSYADEDPVYGIWYEWTSHFQWLGGMVSVTSLGNSFHSGSGGASSNYLPSLYLPRLGLFTIPLVDPGSEPIPHLPEGAAYVRTSATPKLKVRINGAFKGVDLT